MTDTIINHSKSEAEQAVINYPGLKLLAAAEVIFSFIFISLGLNLAVVLGPGSTL